MSITTTQVAERLGLSRKRVNDYINDGKLPAVKGKQGHNFILNKKLDEFHELHREASNFIDKLSRNCEKELSTRHTGIEMELWKNDE